MRTAAQRWPRPIGKGVSLPHEDAYVDECHLCFLARKALLQRFPQYLAPKQVYGL